MKSYSRKKIFSKCSKLKVGEKNNAAKEFLISNFSKHLLVSKENACFDFNKLETYIDTKYMSELIVAPPKVLALTTNLVPIRSIIWGDSVVGFLYLRAGHLNTENETQKMMNIGLILNLLRCSLEPFSLKDIEDQKDILVTNSWITYIIETDFNQHSYLDKSLDFFLHLDLVAIVIALGLKKLKRR